MSPKKMMRSYTAEYREQAVRLVISENLSVEKAARDLGMPPQTLYQWVRNHKDSDIKADAAKPHPRADAPLPTRGRHASSLADEQRIRDLERQVRRLSMEREILKKAMAYCIDLPK